MAMIGQGPRRGQWWELWRGAAPRAARARPRASGARTAATRGTGPGWAASAAGWTRAAGVVAAGLAGLAGGAAAQGAAPGAAQAGTQGIPAASAEWRGQVTPYVWATGLGGELRPFSGAPTVEVDTSFSDLLGDLDGALFVSGLAVRGRLVLLGDLSWSSSSRAGRLPAPAPGLPAEARLRQASVTLAGGWRAVDTRDGTVDIMAGLRHWRLSGRVTVPPVPGVFPGAQASATRSFTDPILAARANLHLAQGWSVIVYADIGGFGVGSRSTAQLLGTVNHRVGEQLTLSAGYRHLTVDYRRGGSRFDLRMGGPILGATWQF